MIQNDVEYILCAAIWFDDHKEHVARPVNIDYGVVFCGHRHLNVYAQLPWDTEERNKLGIKEIDQGFLTSKNRFVTREEASVIAKNAGQCTDSKCLCSEDLY